MSDQQPGKQLFMLAKWVLKPEHVEEWLETEYEAWKVVHNQPECILFEILRDPERPNVFRLLECWTKDKEWFDNVQIRTPAYDKLWKLIERGVTEEPPSLEYYDRFGDQVNGSIVRRHYLEGGKVLD
ncbi:hypothetical protein LTS08_004374 [Lithohypha guttulata]|uniref:ABM domain-containing protein n=1 Tax=Lithohypha guttulata TaxID=1690604 RepID=A0AAN7T011_9EURO|nr:hypothetical protein LTR05_003484 [Lithohypha guttulata]KAK5101915.1 hypothetical protein LTS08_004374 [Lithohypha guttulata]